MVAEVFDELTGYHAGLDYEQAVETIRRKSGSWLDPRAVEIFLGIPRSEWETIKGRLFEKTAV